MTGHPPRAEAVSTAAADAPPLPATDRATAAWWAAAAEGRLLVQTCGSCRIRQHPPGPVCRGCGTTDALVLDDHDGRGRLVSVTTVAQSTYPAWRERVPYRLALVDLDPSPSPAPPAPTVPRPGACTLALLTDPHGAPRPDAGAAGRLGFTRVGGHPVLTFTTDSSHRRPDTPAPARERGR